MPPVTLALYWHQHQPYYPDDVSGETLMPWVRLHGTKDYYGMALHIKEVPEFRCTINLVPSLLLQVQRYTDGGQSDRHLDLSRRPADGLSEADLLFLLDNFFMANVDSMIRPYSRYHELYLKRGVGTDTARAAASRFTTREIRDLQVWSNLTWIHELAFEDDAELREFRAKGRGWNEREKQWLLDKQREILARIIPLHRELAEGGQIELTTTPYYHPILPLLWDKRLARQAMPACALPRHLDPYREDAGIHLRRAVEYHKTLFGKAPVGMWPSEGSVAQDIIGAVAEAGFKWMATDEEILAESTHGWVARDGQGHLRHPEMLYRPWKIEEGDKSLQIIFRDHALSDLIGFHYQRNDPQQAAGDMISRLLAIGRGVEGASGPRPALVPVILDGENCWEYYADGGVKFLRTLYRDCVKNANIRPMRVSDHLKEYPATDRISQLFAGSWISHNFAIWIGHTEDNDAWDLLYQAREFVKGVEAEKSAAPEALARAWEEIFIAEGSDWYWWFGEDHSSAQDALFDQLFRKHLQNAYVLLGASPPHALNHPIKRLQKRKIHTEPTGFLKVKVDGRRTYFEWINAARYTAGSERGTMTMVTVGLVREVHFGFDAERLMIRVDTAGRAVDDLAAVDDLVVRFIAPEETELRISGLRQRSPSGALVRRGEPVGDGRVEVAVDQILEVRVPFAAMELKPAEPIQMFLDIVNRKRSVERAPQEGFLELSVPSPDFEREMWLA